MHGLQGILVIEQYERIPHIRARESPALNPNKLNIKMARVLKCVCIVVRVEVIS
jgi:hypothetical protein